VAGSPAARLERIPPAMKKDPPPPLPPDLLASLEGHGETRDFEAGDVLFHEGEASSHLYIILSGELQVFASKNGRELVYGTLHPREYFGELSLDGNPRSASVRAVAPSRCLVIPGDTARTLVRTHPEFASHLVDKLIHLLRRSTHTLKRMALDDVYERIVALIDEEAVLDGGVLHLPRALTQQEIANRIGASREMVSHVLRELKRGGFVAKVPRLGLAIRKNLPLHW
jgi:CRP/FNR family cyclic AMP-dependent transcriptional regulator